MATLSRGLTHVAIPRSLFIFMLFGIMFLLLLLVVVVRHVSVQGSSGVTSTPSATVTAATYLTADRNAVPAQDSHVPIPAHNPVRIAIDPNAASVAPGIYPQLGYLKPASGSGSTCILPIYGRQSLARNNRVFYYTIIPNSGIKVPLHSTSSGKRDCMDDVGCEEMSSGDLVTVPDAAAATGMPEDTLWTVVIYKYNRL